jgi:lipopolysaccharide export system protein LptC
LATENLYSHVVAWLKILLPLAALGILSSVVFFARESEDIRTIPFVTEAESEDTPGPRLNQPEFVGITGDGSAITLRAEQVTPIENNTELLSAETISGTIQSEDGRVIETEAIEGTFDLAASLATLLGQVQVRTSDGITFEAEGFEARLDASEARSDGPVQGEAPFGRFEAGAMELTQSETRGNLLVFKNGVKLVYTPGQK